MSITTNVIKVAAALAADYAQKGITITPLADTPIGDIRAQSRVSMASEPKVYSTLLGKTTDGGNAQMPNAVNAVQDQLDGFETKLSSAREEATKKYVDMCAQAVTEHLSFARNTVKPVIVSAIENFNSLYAVVSDPSDDIKITKYFYPELFKNSEFSQEMASIDGKGYEKQRVNSATFNLPNAMGYQQIIDLLTNAFPSYKTEISLWLTRLGSSGVESVWSSIFKSTKDVLATNVEDVLVMDYLMCKAMRDNPPEGVAMNLNMWRTNMDEHIYSAMVRLSVLLKKYAASTNQGTLVRSKAGKVVEVYSEEYDKFISEGGSDALIKANCISKEAFYHSKIIIESAERLTKSWDAYAAAQITLKRADQVNIARKSAYSAVEALIVTDYAKLIGWQEPEGAPQQLGSDKVIMAKRAFQKKCDEITINTLPRMAEFFTNSICEVFFADTASYKILTGLDNAAGENPSIDPKQAAAISILEYICQYVADQLVAVKRV